MNDGNRKIKIFISHSVDEDGDLAEMLRDKLIILGGRDYVDVFISKDIAGGKEWHAEIRNNLKDTDVLVVLYTSIQQDLQWLIYEAGFFQGIDGDSKKRIVCIKNPDLSKPPSPLEPLQSYNGNHDGIHKFLVDLLLEGKLTNGVKINANLNNDRLDRDHLTQAYISLAKLFSDRRVSVDNFPQRLKIVLQHDGTGTTADPLTNARVEANGATRLLLNLPHHAKLQWTSIYSQLQTRGHGWADDVVASVTNIQRDLRPRQIMTPFESRRSVKCYPLLAQVERKQNIPISLTIIFAEEDSGEPQEINGEPEYFQTLNGMLSMARRFRWTIIEKHLDRLRLRADTDAETKAEDLLSSLNQLEEEARTKGWMSPALVRACFPDNTLLIDEIFATYGEEKQSLEHSVRTQDTISLIKSLSSLQSINKRFYLLGLQRFRDLAEYTLEPKDVLPTGEIRRRIDDDPIWERLEGSWTGKACDIRVPRLLKYEKKLRLGLRLDVQRKDGRVKSMMTVEVDNPEIIRKPIKTLCLPVYASGSYFSVKYGIDDRRNTHYGVTMLHINPEGRKIEGFYLSRKLWEENAIGFGFIDLTKNDELVGSRQNS